MLASMKDVLNAAPGRVITSVYDTGVYRWMHAKFSVFVPGRGLDAKAVLSIGAPEGSASGSASTQGTQLTTAFVRAKTWQDFMECLNLMFMFVTVLGLATAPVFSQFLQDFVFSPMRLTDLGAHYRYG